MKASRIFCPCCDHQLVVERSGRTSYFTVWSDGFSGRWASMTCRYSSCSHCGHAFWVEDAQGVENLEIVLEPGAAPSNFIEKVASIFGYSCKKSVLQLQNLATELPSGEIFKLALPNLEQLSNELLRHPGVLREAYLRRYRLHLANHQDRGIDVSRIELVSSDDKVEDLEWLLAYNESRPNEDRDVVFEAELLRELGMFEASMKRMDMAVGAGSVAALAIHEQASKGCNKVCISREFGPVIY